MNHPPRQNESHTAAVAHRWTTAPFLPTTSPHPPQKHLLPGFNDVPDTSLTSIIYNNSMSTFQASQSSWSNLHGSWVASDLEPATTCRQSVPGTEKTVPTPAWTEFGASLAGAAAFIHEEPDDDDYVPTQEKHEYSDDDTHTDKGRYSLDHSIISLDLNDLGLDETAHCHNKSAAHFAPPRSSSLPPQQPQQAAGFLSVVPSDDDSTVEPFSSRHWLLRRLKGASPSLQQRGNDSITTDEDASFMLPPPPPRRPIQMRRNSLASMDHRWRDTTTNEACLVPPVRRSKQMRRSSLTAMDHSAHTEVPVMSSPARSHSKQLRRNSLTAMDRPQTEAPVASPKRRHWKHMRRNSLTAMESPQTGHAEAPASPKRRHLKQMRRNSLMAVDHPQSGHAESSPSPKRHSKQMRRNSLTAMDHPQSGQEENSQSPKRHSKQMRRNSLTAMDHQQSGHVESSSPKRHSKQMRRNSLTAVERHGRSGGHSTTTEEASAAPSNLSRKLRRDSLTSLDHQRFGGNSTATEEASLPTSLLLSQRLLKDSLTSLDSQRGGSSITTEDASIPPASLLSQKIRQDSFTSVDRGGDSDDNGDSFVVSSSLTRHLLHDSLNLARYNASVVTEETDPVEAATQSPLSRRLNRYGKSRVAAGTSVDTEDSIPVSSLLSTRGGRRKLPHDSLTLSRYNDTGESFETEDSALVKSPLAQRQLQDSLMLSRYNSSGSVATEDSGRASSPFSMRRLQDSLMLSRYNSSSDALDEQEDSFCRPPSQRMLQDSLMLSRYNSSGSLDEKDDDLDLEDYAVDLIHIVRQQITIIQDKLATKRVNTTRRKSVQRQHSHVGNSPKSLYEFFDSDTVDAFSPERKVTQTGLTVASPTQSENDACEQTNAGMQRSIVQLTASLALLEEQQPQPVSLDTAYTDHLSLLSTIAEQVKASCSMVATLQDDNEPRQQMLNQNATQIVQIKHGLEKRQALSLHY